jgi:transposase
LTGILFVLKSGIPWKMLPQEMGWGCGMSCWRRLQAWQRAGFWERLYQFLLSHLDHACFRGKARGAAYVGFALAVAELLLVAALLIFALLRGGGA